MKQACLQTKKYIAILTAVNHDYFKELTKSDWQNLCKENGIYFDIKGMIPRELNAIRL